MLKQSTPITSPKVPASELTLITRDISKATTPLITAVRGLVVVDPEGYEKADAYLSRIGGIREALGERVKAILAPLDRSKKEIDTARKELTSFRDDLDKPLALAEGAVREMMREFKLEENRQLEAAKFKQLEEDLRLQREMAEVERKMQAAPSPKESAKLADKLIGLDMQAAKIERETPVPVVAAGSNTRQIRKVRITNLKAVLGAIVSGKIPEDVVDLDKLEGALERYRKVDDAGVQKWPGVEVYTDVQIVRRG